MQARGALSGTFPPSTSSRRAPRTFLEDMKMGLSTSGTVSERHAAARQDASKVTAGQLAARMRRAGMPVTAAELRRWAPEWHHSGWIPGPARGGSRMGRTYFFPIDTDIEKLYANVLAERARKAANPPPPAAPAGDVVVHYEEIVRSTRKAALYRVGGREVWIGDFQCRAHDWQRQTITIPARVAQEKGLAPENTEREETATPPADDDRDVLVDYEDILHCTRGGALYLIDGRQVWIHNNDCRDWDDDSRVLTLPKRVARAKGLLAAEVGSA